MYPDVSKEGEQGGGGGHNPHQKARSICVHLFEEFLQRLFLFLFLFGSLALKSDFCRCAAGSVNSLDCNEILRGAARLAFVQQPFPHGTIGAGAKLGNQVHIGTGNLSRNDAINGLLLVHPSVCKHGVEHGLKNLRNFFLVLLIVMVRSTYTLMLLTSVRYDGSDAEQQR